MLKPIVVNLAGGPGAGKSTTRAGVFSLLKLHGVNAEEAPEFAKDLTWEKRHITLQNQYYIFGKQHHRLFRLNDVDVIVTDSPLFLSAIYATLSKHDPHFIETIKTAFNSFTNINYIIRRVKEYNPKGRNQTETEAMDIDNIVRNFLDSSGIEYYSADGNFNGINMIAKDILEKYLGIQMTIKFS